MREALKQSGRIGIAKIVFRDSQRLAAVEVIENALVLTMMRYADELVDDTRFTFPAADHERKAELDMAKALVDNLASEWSPEKYTDEHQGNLARLIEAKVKGKHPRLGRREPSMPGNVVDLMERLQKSLEGARQAKASSKKVTGRRAARARKTSHAA